MRRAFFRTSGADRPIVIGGLPRVDLLPPSVRDRYARQKMRRSLGCCIVGSVVVVAVFAGATTFLLDREQAALAQLRISSKALALREKDYASAADATTAADQLSTARTFVGETDIEWVPLLATLAGAVGPEGAINSTSSVSAVSWAASAAAPTALSPAALAPTAVATTSIVITFPSLDALQKIVSRILNLPEVVSASPGAVTAAGALYSTTLSVSLGSNVLSGRFSAPTSGLGDR